MLSLIAPVLDYGGQTAMALRPAHRTLLYRIGLACWLLPLGAGLTIYLASEVVRLNPSSHGGVAPTPAMDFLQGAGLLTIIIGTGLAGIGAAVALAFVASRWSAAVNRWTQVVAPALTLLGLLAINFPVALAVMRLAMR